MNIQTVNERSLPKRGASRIGVVAATLAAAAFACNSAPARSVDASVAGAAGDSAIDALRARADLARIAGDSAAPLWLVVASDFQCPYCARWHRDTYPALREDYVRTGKVRLAYVNFPLDYHRHAGPAASAALCAGAQTRFWEMHDAIFDTQERWTPLADARPLFDSLANSAVTDIDSWRRCISEGTMDAVVAADRARVGAAGVQSTPSFLISYARGPARRGQLIRGAAPLAEFRQVLDSMHTIATR